MGEHNVSGDSLNRCQIATLYQLAKGEWKQQPVWDGNIISSHDGQQLVEMGLAYHSHGYWFPSLDGEAWIKWLLVEFRSKKAPKRD